MLFAAIRYQYQYQVYTRILKDIPSPIIYPFIQLQNHVDATTIQY